MRVAQESPKRGLLLTDSESVCANRVLLFGPAAAGCNKSFYPGCKETIMEVDINMSKALFILLRKIRELAKRETGQDLVEYALVVAMIAFGAVAGMKRLATGITTAYDNVSTQLVSAM
jgi:pilus assembly protein Flp/PilA